MNDTTRDTRSARRARHAAILAEVAHEEAAATEAECAEQSGALDIPLLLRIDRELDAQLRSRALAEQIPTSALVRRLPRQAIHEQRSTEHNAAAYFRKSEFRGTLSSPSSYFRERYSELLATEATTPAGWCTALDVPNPTTALTRAVRTALLLSSGHPGTVQRSVPWATSRWCAASSRPSAARNSSTSVSSVSPVKRRLSRDR